MQIRVAGNSLTAIADTPTPAYGHPFPKEGELSFDRCGSQWPELSSHIRFFLQFLHAKLE